MSATAGLSVRTVRIWAIVCGLALLAAGLSPAGTARAAENAISGTVVAPAWVNAATWLPTVTVTATTGRNWASPGVTASVGTDGSFVIPGLNPASTYFVNVRDSSNVTARSWFRADGVLTVSGLNAVTVALGTDDITLAPKRPATISGQVNLPTDLPANLPSWALDDLALWFYSANGFTYEEVRDQDVSDGTFEVTGLLEGESYYVIARHPWLNQGWLTASGTLSGTQADRVPVAAGTSNLAITIPSDLVRPAIRGTIHLPEDLPGTPRLRLQAYYESGNGFWNNEMYQEEVGPDGSFFVGGLSNERTYRLKLTDSSRLLSEGFLGADDTWHLDASDGINIPVNFPVGSPIQVYPARAATVSGTFTVAPGATLHPSARVTALPLTASEPQRTATLGADGSYEILGLRHGAEYEIRLDNTDGVTAEPAPGGYLGAGGLLYPYREHAVAVTAPSSTADATVLPYTTLSGRVELPESFTYDAGNPPTVLPYHRVYFMAEPVWDPAGSPEPVAADGTFQLPQVGPQTPYRLRLTWPDGASVYWVSDTKVPTADASKAGTTTPRSNVVFPLVDAPDPAPQPQPEEPLKNLVATKAPRITGAIKHGKTLRTDGGTWSAPGPRLTYQWLRGGKAIKGATKATYKVAKKDIGQRLSVCVTASAPGHRGATATSPVSKKVPKAAPKVTVKVRPKGTSRSKVQVQIRVRATGITAKPTGTLKVTYAKKTRTIKLTAKRKGVVTVKVPRTKRLGALKVRYAPTGASKKFLTARTSKAKVTKLSPTVTLKAPKTTKASSRVKATIRVRTPGITAKPTGEVRLTYGKKSRTVALTARHRGKITVTLPKLTKGTYTLRARYAPAKTWKKYVKAKHSTKVTARVR